MARIKLGPAITDIAGSIGGTTIQRNRFGLTIRAKPLPLKSETPAQYNVRQKIAYLQYSWQRLSDAQRLQWDRFLDFSGQTIRRDRSIKLSGQALFIKYNLYRLLCGLEVLDPISYDTQPLFSLPDGVIIYLDTLVVRFPETFSPDYWFFIFKMTNPRSANQVYSPKGLRFMKIPIQVNYFFYIQDEYIKAFGVLPSAGSYFHYNILFFHTSSPVFTGIFTGTMQVTA